jgi:DNA-directed RNA polymerase specialized sigma24 family protein
MRHELKIWQRTAASVSSYSKDEDLVRETLLKKARRLSGELRVKMLSGRLDLSDFIYRIIHLYYLKFVAWRRTHIKQRWKPCKRK